MVRVLAHGSRTNVTCSDLGNVKVIWHAAKNNESQKKNAYGPLVIRYDVCACLL
jgi:hypothetical protein